MNDTLDVLRYWLPEWRFSNVRRGGVDVVLAEQACPGTGLTYSRYSDIQEHADCMAAELRRKYLERETVRIVEVSLTKGACEVIIVCYEAWDKPSTYYSAMEPTELLATIAAGAKLREALEPGEGT